MLDLTLDSDRRRAELAPARALLTPTWVAALALLVANDHWLKGSGLVPGVLTGKLSDFAGMLVAPVLLASLLRVRSRRALALCHVAVGAVFAGIQLSPGFAGQWSALMGLVGHPWAITCDPTDLIALPFLLLSWALLVPAMDPGKPALVPIQRTAVAALSVFGLWSTVATSDDGGFDVDDEWYVDVYGYVVVNNANDQDVSLYIREIRHDLLLDCDEVSLDPGRLLAPEAFGEAEHWLLPGRTNVAIDFEYQADCSAAMIGGEGIPTTIVFIDRHEIPPQWFPGQTFDPAELGAAGIAIEFDDGGSQWVGGDKIRFSPKTDAPELPGECEVPEAESRLDWPSSVPTRDVELVEVSGGPDGCYELLVQELQLSGGEVVEQGPSYPFFLCAPELAMPWAAGERVEMDYATNGAGERELVLTLLEPDSLTPMVTDGGANVRRVRYARGTNAPDAITEDLDRGVVGIPSFSCPWIVEDGCATVERTTALAVEGADFLEVGVPLELADEAGPGTMRTMILAYARERAVLDRTCSDGATTLSYDIDYVVIEEPLI